MSKVEIDRIVDNMGMIFGKIDVERPPYDVVARGGDFEVRSYPRITIAKVVADGDGHDNGMFRILAKYIGVFGTALNAEGTKMAMTAPVLSSSKAQAEMKPTILSSKGGAMAFVLPKSFSAATAPVPTDERIKVEDVAARHVAVHTFSGLATESSAAKKAAMLQDSLEKAGYTIKDTGYELARYNPPFTLPFLRTNEIWFSVEIKDE